MECESEKCVNGMDSRGVGRGGRGLRVECESEKCVNGMDSRGVEGVGEEG